MNLYLITRTSPLDYDMYDSAVVAARSEKAARETHPNGEDAVAPRAYNSWEESPAEVNVELIGTAVPGTKAGVVCASFNAG